MEYNLEKISTKIHRKKVIIGIIKKIISVVLILIFIANSILLYYNFKGEETPDFMNIYFFNIVSGSMEPTLYVNDIIIVKKIDSQNLLINDIVTFTKDEKIISHRILNIQNLNGKLVFQTKGDNNEVQDDFLVKEDEIYGKVLFKISKIGKLVQYIQEENGFVKTVIMIAIIFILFTLNDNKKNKRKITRKKYEIKKTRETYNDL